jgi:hypothetical protein
VARHSSLWVRILDPFGSGKGRLVERLEVGLVSSFEMCPTAARPGNILRRSLTVFNAAGLHTSERAARHLYESNGWRATLRAPIREPSCFVTSTSFTKTL